MHAYPCTVCVYGLLGAGFYCLSLSFLCNLCLCMCVCARACSPQISVLLFFLVAYCNVASGFFCICFFWKTVIPQIPQRPASLVTKHLHVYSKDKIYICAHAPLSGCHFFCFVLTFIYLTRTYCGGSLQSTALQLKIPADRKMLQKYTNHNTTQHKGWTK